MEIINTENAARPIDQQQPQTPPITITQKLGHTTYEVYIHFSQTSKETINDKILRLISNDIRTNKIS